VARAVLRPRPPYGEGLRRHRRVHSPESRATRARETSGGLNMVQLSRIRGGSCRQSRRDNSLMDRLERLDNGYARERR
jgi:hypothetical protein